MQGNLARHMAEADEKRPIGHAYTQNSMMYVLPLLQITGLGAVVK